MKSIVLNYARKNRHTLVAIGICGILLAIGGIIRPGFVSYKNVLNILSLASFLGILAAGQTFAVLSGGEGLDLSVGAVASFSAIVAAHLLGPLNLPLVIVLLIIMALGAVLGFINGLGITYAQVPPLVMTLGMIGVINGLSLVYSGGQPTGGATEILQTISTGRIFGIPWILVIWLAFIFTVLFVLKRTTYGRALYAVGSNREAAYISGAKVEIIKILAYSFSGLLSAFGGLMLLGFVQGVQYEMGSNYMLPSVIAVVLGGVSFSGGEGEYFNVVLGAIILTILTSLLTTLNIGEAGRMLVNGFILLALLTAFGRAEKMRK